MSPDQSAGVRKHCFGDCGKIGIGAVIADDATKHLVINISGIVFLLAAMALGQHLDTTAAEADAASASLRDAQAQARAEARRDRAAAKLCIDIAGPGAAWHWTADGHLVCAARRGGLPVTNTTHTKETI